jgi:hypothetical protein
MGYAFYSSPNDSPKDGTIHPLGLAQLAVFQEAAIMWPRYPDGRAIRCGKCDQSMYFTLDPGGKPYRYSDDEIMALIVAHIRQNHEEAVNATH